MAFAQNHFKVKAHQAIDSLEGDEKWKATCNDCVDRAAKAALETHPASVGMQFKASCAAANVECVLTLAAAVLPLWPRAERCKLRAPRRVDAAAPAPARLIIAHDWTPVGGKLRRCKACWRISALGDQAADSCLGRPKFLDDVAHDSHAMVCLSCDTGPIAACMHCGSWGMKKAVKLREVCFEPTRAGRASLRRVMHGKHPHPNRDGGVSFLGDDALVRATLGAHAIARASLGTTQPSGVEQAL